MPEPGSSDPASDRRARPPRGGGIGSHAAAAAGSFLDYLEARFRLAGLEAREARGAILRRLIAAGAGAFLMLIAYLIIITGIIGWISTQFDKPWPLVTLGAGLVHVGLGFGCFFYAKQQFRDPPFNDTRKEFDKDRQWLNSFRPPKS